MINSLFTATLLGLAASQVDTSCKQFDLALTPIAAASYFFMLSGCLGIAVELGAYGNASSGIG